MVVVNGRRGLYLTTSFIYLSFTGDVWYANSNTRDGTRCTKNHRVSAQCIWWTLNNTTSCFLNQPGSKAYIYSTNIEQWSEGFGRLSLQPLLHLKSITIWHTMTVMLMLLLCGLIAFPLLNVLYCQLCICAIVHQMQ